jgi:hypothetical protein
MVENIRRGEPSELRLPLSARNSNKRIGEIIIGYYLENIHLPNLDFEKSFFSEKINGDITPSTNNSKRHADQLLMDPLSEVDDFLDILDSMTLKDIKYAKKYNFCYVETTEFTNLA